MISFKKKNKVERNKESKTSQQPLFVDVFVTLTRAIVLCSVVLRLRALFHVSVNIRMLIDFIMGLHTCAVQTLCSVDMTNSAATPMVPVSRKAHIFSFSLYEDDLNDFKLEQVV